MYAVKADEMLAGKDGERLDELVFDPPGDETKDLKLVSSDNRCLLWNKSNNAVYELIFKDIKTQPTSNVIWDSENDPVTNIFGGTDGRFAICTTMGQYLLNGDKLEKLDIPDKYIDGETDRFLLGDGWELFFGWGAILGRGKSMFLWSAEDAADSQTLTMCFRTKPRSLRNGPRSSYRRMRRVRKVLSSLATCSISGQLQRRGRSDCIRNSNLSTEREGGRCVSGNAV